MTRITYKAEYDSQQNAYSPDEHGYYGKFGGAFIPEMLHRNVEELRTKYLEIIAEASFQKEYEQLLQVLHVDHSIHLQYEDSNDH